jgi:hypothetical protein
MFASKKSIPARAADVLDLIIEFATLGEYGLEYPEGTFPETAQSEVAPSPCEKRTHALRPADANGRSGRGAGGAGVTRGDRPRDRRDPSGTRTRSDCRENSSTEPMDYRAALRTPRVRLSFAN